MPLHIIGGRIGVTGQSAACHPGHTRLTRILCGPIRAPLFVRALSAQPWRPHRPLAARPMQPAWDPITKMEPPSVIILAAAVVIVR